jgi:hypothetical protein
LITDDAKVIIYDRHVFIVQATGLTEQKINYASSVINKLEALITDGTRVVIYDRHVFIVQVGQLEQKFFGQNF